jgi:ubiquinone/menaquinone biosynthesis C-methylase UbiE
MSTSTAEPSNARATGIAIGQFSGVDASGQSERLIAFLEQAESLPHAVATRQASYALLQANPGDHVVDVGCGAGRAVAEMLQRGLRVTGVDRSKAMTTHARSRFPRADFQCAFAEELPFADESLLGYRAERVYSHIHDPRPALAEARRVLAPGGRFVLADVENDLWAIDSDDRAMTRAMIRAFADAVANPWIGRSCRSLLLEAGFVHVTVDFQPVIVTTSYPKVTEALANAAVVAGVVSPNESDTWLAEQKRRVEQGAFFAAVPIFIVSARRS